jgi:NarL family two-component system response regulator LiaR
VVEALRAPESANASLSEREREVLMLIAEGMGNQQIATKLGIGEKTVKTHVSNILAKLDLNDRTQVAVWAWRQGLMPPQKN